MAMQDHLIKPIESAAYTVQMLQRYTNVSGGLRSQLDKRTAPITQTDAGKSTFASDVYAGGSWAVNNKLSTFVFNAADYAIGHGKDAPLPTPAQSAADDVSHMSDCVIESTYNTVTNGSSTGLLGGLVTMWTLPFAAAGGIAVGVAFAGVGAVGDAATKLRPSWGAKGEPYAVKAAALGAAVGAAVSLAAVAVYLPVTVMVGSKALVVAFPMVALHGLRAGVTLAKAAVFAAGLVVAVPVTLAQRAGSLMYNAWTCQVDEFYTPKTFADETGSVHGGMTEVDIDEAFAAPASPAASEVSTPAATAQVVVGQGAAVDPDDAAGASLPATTPPAPRPYRSYSFLKMAADMSQKKAPPASSVASEVSTPAATAQVVGQGAAVGLGDAGDASLSASPTPTYRPHRNNSFVKPATGVSPTEAPPAGAVSELRGKYEGKKTERAVLSSRSSYFSFKTANTGLSPAESPNQ
jgi:hypothetical protein